MKIFIGSSIEASKKGLLDDLALIIERAGHTVCLWTDVESFIAGDSTLESLTKLADDVDGAILVFTEDDKTWYRTEYVSAPRDNVVFELGLFMGWLKNTKKAIIVKVEKAKVLNDLAGITYINYSEGATREGKKRIEKWLEGINPDSEILIPTVQDYYHQIQEINDIGFHIDDDRRILSFKTSENYTGLLERNYKNKFTVIGQKKIIANFKLVFNNDFMFPDNVTDLKNIISFSISSKVCSFTLDDCEISSFERNGKRYGRINLTKYLDIPTGTVFTVTLKSLVQEYANIETFSARYPTKGFSVSLEYSPNFHYDNQYFKANTFLDVPNSDLEELTIQKESGIETSTHEWFVTGEGIAIAWFPK